MKITVIDVGGTFIKFACMNEQAEIIFKNKFQTQINNENEFVQTIKMIHNQISNSEGIAISLPGIVDSEHGIWIYSQAFPFSNNFKIVQRLEDECKCRVVVENDARCATIAEMMIGSLNDVDNGMVIVFGTSIGSSYFLNRKIHRGENFSAGEICFLITNEQGDTFQKCSTTDLCKRYSKSINGEEFFNAVSNDDEVAVDILNQVTKQIAIQIFNVHRILDLKRIAIGGGISEQKIFIDLIRQHLNDLHSKTKLLNVEITSCKFKNDSNLIGALQNYIKR